MTALRATYYFPLERLCVERDLGTTHELSVDGSRVRVTPPAREAGPRMTPEPPDLAIFPEPDPEPLPLIEGGADLRTSATAVSSADLAHVDLIRVQVLFERRCVRWELWRSGD